MNNSAVVNQRVHNVFHHLQDGSLPYDLWNAEAELAAIVYLLKRYPTEAAADVYARTVRQYNESNERAGTAVKPFHVESAASQVRRVSTYVESFPPTASAAKIYVSLLHSSSTSPRQ